MEQELDPLVIAEAVAALLEAKLAPFDAREVVLTRDEAAMCLGLIRALAELLGDDKGAQH